MSYILKHAIFLLFSEKITKEEERICWRGRGESLQCHVTNSYAKILHFPAILFLALEIQTRVCHTATRLINLGQIDFTTGATTTLEIHCRDV